MATSASSIRVVPSTEQAVTGVGKYRYIAMLAEGGMADVYLAVTQGSGFEKLVVIKQLRDTLAEDPSFVAMFMDEARLAARLNHPNVVQTLEVGTDEKTGRHFIAMEFLEGIAYVKLARMKERIPPPLAFQIRILVDVLRGLHYAHELRDFDGKPLNVVHRDVSPQNVMLTFAGGVKVLDFGIAKAALAAEQRPEDFKGKLEYMAPEQARMEDVDRRADVFSVGVMLFEALARRRLYKKGENKLHALINGRLPNILEVAPATPRRLAAICGTALAHERTARFPDADAMADELEEWLGETTQHVTARDVGSFIADKFSSTRAKISAAIEAQLTLVRQVQEITPDTIPLSRLPITDMPPPLEPFELIEADQPTSLLRRDRDFEPATPLAQLALPPIPAIPFDLTATNIIAKPSAPAFARTALMPEVLPGLIASSPMTQDMANAPSTTRDLEPPPPDSATIALRPPASARANGPPLPIPTATSSAPALALLTGNGPPPPVPPPPPSSSQPGPPPPLPLLTPFTDGAPALARGLPMPMPLAPSPSGPWTTSELSTSPRRRQNMLFAAIAVVGAVIVGGAVTLLVTRSKPSRDAVTATPSIASSVAVASAQASATPDPTIEFTIRASPSEAKITLDGMAMSTNPIVGKRARDGALHTLRIEAQGFETREESISFERSVLINIELRPSSWDATPAKAAKRASTTSTTSTSESGGERSIRPPTPTPATRPPRTHSAASKTIDPENPYQ